MRYINKIRLWGRVEENFNFDNKRFFFFNVYLLSCYLFYFLVIGFFLRSGCNLKNCFFRSCIFEMRFIIVLEMGI